MYHPPLAGGSRLSMMDTHMPAKSLQLCPTLHGPVDCSPPGSSLHGILQARILEWLAMPSSRGSPWLRGRTCVSRLLNWQETHTFNPPDWTQRRAHFIGGLCKAAAIPWCIADKQNTAQMHCGGIKLTLEKHMVHWQHQHSCKCINEKKFQCLLTTRSYLSEWVLINRMVWYKDFLKQL